MSNGGFANLLLAGGCACAADAATFPVDTLKVRLQTTTAGASAGVWQTTRRLLANDGVVGFYSGLGAGLQRQFAFASIRIGFYEPVKQLYVRRLGVDETNGAALLGVRLLAGVTTGALAVCCAQPTDVVKVRMQAGAGHFSGCWAAYAGIFKAEGLAGLWRGLWPNVARNSIVNCAEVVSYDTIKTHLVAGLQLPDTVAVHFASGLGSGFIATVVASPVDVVKTRMMSGQAAGVLPAATALYRQSGVAGFYKGFVPSFVRIAGWNILMFVGFEKAKSAMAAARSRREVLLLPNAASKQLL